MKQPIRSKAMPIPLLCAQQEFLRHLAHVAGVEAVTVWAVKKKGYLLSALIQGKTQEWFLATRREPRVPRAFTRLDAAVRTGQRLFKVPTMTVVCHPNTTPNTGTGKVPADTDGDEAVYQTNECTQQED